jgi:hypothetical protein
MTTSTIRARRVGPLVVVSGLHKTNTASRAPRHQTNRRTAAMILGMPRWLFWGIVILVAIAIMSGN